MTAPHAAFYCVADSRYFPGAAGMINSLRLLGHEEPIFLLDCGLTESQRALLQPHVSLVPGPHDVPPYLLKTIAPLRHPANVMVLIDADIVATRSLAALIERASGGCVLAIKDGEDRHFLEWGDLLGVAAIPRRPYVSSSFVILGEGLGEDVLRLMHEAQARVDLEDTPYGLRVRDRALSRGDHAAAPEHPFFYPEQDVLNAILAAKVGPERMEVLDRRLEAAPPFKGLRVIDEGALRCAYRDGMEPYLLHHIVVKPWLDRAFHGPYSRLLRRLLLGSDVAVRVGEAELPMRMRSGARAWVARTAVSIYDLLRWYLRDLPARFRERVQRLRRGAIQTP